MNLKLSNLLLGLKTIPKIYKFFNSYEIEYLYTNCLVAPLGRLGRLENPEK